MQINWRRRLVFALVVAAAVLGCLELGLRAAGFRFERSLSFMQFNFPDPDSLHRIFEPDPELLWRMRPSYQMGPGFPLTNRHGFRGPEFTPEKKSGVLRVICLGDSVTFGRPEVSYPELLGPKLEARLGRPVEALNFGVPGYSSWQGRRLLERILAGKYDLRPATDDSGGDGLVSEVFVILFGWNDHWLARGFSDSEQVVEVSRVSRWLDAVRALRLYQLVNRAGSELSRGEGRELKLRVPPSSYRANLAAMAEAGREAGAIALIATSPSAIGEAPPPEFLVALEFIREEEDLARLHREYNELARAAAREAGAPLADLELAFAEAGPSRLFDDPAKDLIHPNPRGYELIAELLAEAIANELLRERE